MSNEEARIYIEYIRVLLDIHGLKEDVLDMALETAGKALVKEDDFTKFCQ